MGGSLLASLGTFQHMWIAREAHDLQRLQRDLGCGLKVEASGLQSLRIHKLRLGIQDFQFRLGMQELGLSICRVCRMGLIQDPTVLGGFCLG